MLIKTLSIIHKTIAILLLLILVFVLSAVGIFLVRHDNLPINYYLSKVAGTVLGSKEVVIERVSLLPFVSIKRTGFRIKLDNIKILKADKELAKVDTVLMHVSLLSLFLGKPSINAVTINKIIINNDSMEDSSNFALSAIPSTIFWTGTFLKDSLDSFNSYFNSAEVNKFKGALSQLCFSTSTECFSGINVTSLVRDNRRFLFANADFHGLTLNINSYMGDFGLNKFSIVGENFDSDLYKKFLNTDYSGHFDAKKLVLSFEYSDAYNMPHIHLDANGINTDDIKIFSWLGVESISNGRVSADIVNNGIVIVNIANFLSSGTEGAISGILDFNKYQFLFDIQCKNTTLAKLYRYMPKPLLVDLHKWLDGHLSKSVIEDAILSIDLGYTDWRNGDYTVNDLHFRVDFLDSVLNLEFNNASMIVKKMKGQYSMHYGSSLVNVDSAAIDDANVSGVISVDDHSEPVLELSCVFNGNAANISQALLNYSSNSDFQYKHMLSRAEGFSEGDFSLSLPIDRYDELWFGLKTSFTGIAISNFIDPLNVSNGNITVNASPTEVEIDGSAILANDKVNFKFFANNAGNKLNFNSQLSNAEVLKIPIVSNFARSFAYLDGNANLNLAMHDINNKGFKIDGSIDFLNSDIEFIHLNVNKKKGDSALLKFAAIADNNKVTLGSGSYTSNAIELWVKEGFFYFDHSEYLFNIFSKKSKQYDFEFLLADKGGDKLSLQLNAKNFDGRIDKWFRSLNSKKSNDNNVEMLINIDNLLMYKDIMLYDFSLESKCSTYRCEWLDFNTFFDNGNIAAGYDGERLCGKTSHVNLLADALGMGGFIQKGKAMFCIDKFLHGNEKMLGKLSATDLHIKKGGLLSDALSADKSLAVVRKKINKKPNQKIIEFEHMHAKFMYNDSIVQIKNGVMYGPFIGVTFNGVTNLESNQIDFNGSLLPAYGINSIMAQVPVIGGIMAGGRGGVIGIDYSIKGSVKQPVLSVNPLSVFVPGILRNFFDVFRKNDIGIEKSKKNIKNNEMHKSTRSANKQH
ncbi:hypothetical protein CAXC1_120033 [Candidatus Xenohaliotis californiensis]|uniref:AsmA-like C-terminal domain-containing protein n=1 Tax=Candidatus Xenohaliotis californiensis TaxID=84677 RepID=A0ABM9N7T2_9RICK|nr:hypothetical protein CAXC1_120033 [Candidatus Xenohaliotis californiensis]